MKAIEYRGYFITPNTTGFVNFGLISLNRYTALHFCSSECFVDYFIMKPDGD